MLETEFAYIVNADYAKDPKDPVGDKISANHVQSETADPDSIQNAPMRLVSSCPDLSKKEMADIVDPDYSNLMMLKNSGFLNGEHDLAIFSNGPTTNLDSSSEDLDSNTGVGEFEYSQQLRRSSKRLSERLRLQGQPMITGQATEIGITPSGQGDLGTLGDVASVDVKTEDNVGLSVTPEVSKVQSSGNVSTVSNEEDVVKAPGEDVAPKEPVDESLTAVVPEVKETLEKIEKLQKENDLLMEDNRELKKKCRTFESKSRLKEKELEEMESAKNELANQVHEMATELHSLRASNTELRTEISEANTKLADVDGWVTRDVFEDIRGQLSLSAEECEQKDEEIREIEKKCKHLKIENAKMHDLEAEVEKLNERIKADAKEFEGMKRDLKGKEKQISELEAESQKMGSLLEEQKSETQVKESKLQEMESVLEQLKQIHELEKKDLEKRMSDKEYEILIMKEEKKELCVKMKAFEGNVETLREELKSKDAEHAAVIAEMEKQSNIKDEVCLNTLHFLADFHRLDGVINNK